MTVDLWGFVTGAVVANVAFVLGYVVVPVIRERVTRK